MVLGNSKALANRKPGLGWSRACRDMVSRTGRHYREDSSNFRVGTGQLCGGIIENHRGGGWKDARGCGCLERTVGGIPFLPLSQRSGRRVTTGRRCAVGGGCKPGVQDCATFIACSDHQGQERKPFPSTLSVAVYRELPCSD